MKKIKFILALILVAMFCIGFLMLPVGVITLIWFNVILGGKIFFTGLILILFATLMIHFSYNWIMDDEN